MFLDFPVDVILQLTTSLLPCLIRFLKLLQESETSIPLKGLVVDMLLVGVDRIHEVYLFVCNRRVPGSFEEALESLVLQLGLVKALWIEFQIRLSLIEILRLI